MFGLWFRSRRRRRWLAEPWPATWHTALAEGLWQFDSLSPEQQTRIRETVTILVREKHWEGCAGQKITDTVQVTIAAQVGLMTLGLAPFYFDHVKTILVYPDAFSMPHRTPVGGQLAIEETAELEGQAWYRGPVILSWPEVAAAGRSPNSGHALVVHEFAHQLDMIDGDDVDGTPPLPTPEAIGRWNEVVDAAFWRLRRECRHGARPLLDCYGATSRAEFFAVASEVFFQRPGPMRQAWPELYATLATFYGWEPFFGDQ